MALKLNKPKVKTGGGFSDKWKVTEAKHTIRVFPFEHDGELHLAGVDVLHFSGQGEAPEPCLGSGCPRCQEAKQTNNNRLKPVTRYPMMIVDIDGDKDAVMRFNAPTTVYKAINSLIETDDDAEMILGNEGTDLIIKYDKNAQPSSRYSVQARLKGSKELEIDEESIIDLIAEVERDRSSVVEDDGGASDIPDDIEDEEPEGEIFEDEEDGDDEEVEDVTGDEDEENEVPEGKVECKACEGTGKSSKGKKCKPCKGEGYVDAPEEEEEEPEEEGDGDDWGTFDDEEEEEETPTPKKGDFVKAMVKGKKTKLKFTGKKSKGKFVCLNSKSKSVNVDPDDIVEVL